MLPPLDLDNSLPYSVAYAPDGDRVAYGTRDGQIHILDFALATELIEGVADADAAVRALAADPEDLASLELLARWYATRQIWTFAARIYDELDALGAPLEVAMTAARTYWVLERPDDARRWLLEAQKRGEVQDYYVSAILADLKSHSPKR